MTFYWNIQTEEAERRQSTQKVSFQNQYRMYYSWKYTFFMLEMHVEGL